MTSHRNRVLVRLSIFVLTVVLAANAHEGEKHLLGTVRTVGNGSFTILTQSNETISLTVLSTTKFVMNGQPAELKDLKPGLRVVVHAKQNDKSWQAQEVHFGHTEKAPSK